MMKYVKYDEPRRDIALVSQCDGSHVYVMFQKSVLKTQCYYQLVHVQERYYWVSIEILGLQGLFAGTGYRTSHEALSHALDSGCTVLQFDTLKEFAEWLYMNPVFIGV